MDVIEANEARDDTYFIIVGNGTEYGRISQFLKSILPVILACYLLFPRRNMIIW